MRCVATYVGEARRQPLLAGLMTGTTKALAQEVCAQAPLRFIHGDNGDVADAGGSAGNLYTPGGAFAIRWREARLKQGQVTYAVVPLARIRPRV